MYGGVTMGLCALIVYGTLVVPFIAKELSLGKKRYSSTPSLRLLPTLMIEYRAAQLLQNLYNSVIGLFLFPFQSLASLMFMVSSFMVITHWDTLNRISLSLMISWSLLAPNAWIIVLMMGAYLHKSGVRVLNSWRHHQQFITSKADRKLMGKFRLSCKSLSVSYNRMYTIKPISTMIFVRGLIKGLLRCLLTMRRN